LYKNLDLEQLGVQELNAVEVKGTDGGHMVGYSKWYREQQASKSADFWFWWSILHQALQ
jgi:hypothetical protein